jgi:UDP-4-amino-4,6-dideoxy-N-acetyl-beta-L-altrosamine N-acetyltransferase
MLEKLINNKDIELVNFLDLSYDEKIMVLEWRNHPNIRKWMFTQDLIALDNHLNYIDSLSSKKDREYFLVKQHNQAVGVIDFTNIDKKRLTVEFGLYVKPNLKGIGSLLMQEIVDYAFNTLKMQTLISEVFEENSLAIKLYKKFNFRSIIKKENIIVMELKNENR